MTLFDVEELVDYWADHPPVHLMVAAYLGVKSDARRSTSTAVTADSALQIQMLGMPGIGMGRPFSEVFGPGALETMRDMWAQFEAVKAGGARQPD